jgi:DNA repair exonuclease SbcCD ATPase subunit
LNIKKIDVGFDKLSKILHIADIHIRNYQRHQEYRQVFKELYRGVDDLPENTIIYVGGDIVHNKTDISPELISITSEFLSKLADKRHTIVITGNHDANLNNTSRLDALTPIINNLNHPQLHYLRDSGVYNIANVHFTVFSIFDPPSEFIKADTFKADTKIALFHGPVKSSKTDIGYEVTGEEYTANLFDGYDLSLLGDIHKRQYVDKEKKICYPGSLIQQNFGESFKYHGYAVWDVAKRKPKYIDILNKYGFYTIDVKNGVLPNIDDIPKQPRLRIRTTNTTEAELKSIIKDIKKKCRVHDIITIKQDKIKGQASTSRALTRDVRDVNYQNKLLQDYIEKNHDIDGSIMRRVKSINKALNNLLLNEDITRNVTWKLRQFNFSNMFSYGGGNTINFEKAKDVIGLFAPNHAGKSAVLDSLTFCIFDRCSRGKSAADIMNNTKNTFECKLHFEIDGTDYFIERKAKRILKGWMKGKVRVDVDFWYVDEEGNNVSLNGEQRRDTDKNIKGYLGEYEDFILTALSVQNNNTGFIDMSQFEKKDLLSQFLDITVFEQLYTLANDEIRDVQALLKDFGSTDYSQQLIDEEDKLDKDTIRHNAYQKEKQVVEDKIKSVQKDILSKTKTLHKRVPLDDVNVLELELLNLETQVNTISSRLESDEKIAAANKEKIKKANKILSSYNIDDVNERYTIYNDTKRNISTLESKRERLKLQVKHKLEKLATNSEFDPTCEFCRKRESEYIEMSKAVKLELDHDKGHVAEVLSELKVYNEYINNNDNIIDDYNKVQQINNLLSGIERERSAGRISYYQAKEKRDVFQQKANDIKKKIEKYHSNIKAIEENKKINDIIDTLTNQENTLKHELNTINSKCQLCYSDIKVCKTNIRNINSHIKKAHELEIRLKAYEYYLDAIKRDGIPYEIISDTLPYIQEEVNNILSQVVDFELEFDVDGKNILTYIKYGDSSWSLDMTSGMEKFISSLAIRVALINISNLPRPTFLAIDEGFGNLDSNNINSISMLFDYLKTEFDFILIISHIDIMKDMVDDVIEISKQGNLSNVIY